MAYVLAIVSLSSVVYAQGGRGGGPGGGGPGGGGPGGGGPGGFGGGPGGFGGGPGGFGGGPGGFGGGPGGFGGGRGGGTNTSRLLTLAEDSAVWDDIKITDEQLGKVTRLRANINKQARKFRENIRTQQQAAAGATNGQGLDPEAARAARDAARQAEREALTENTETVKQQTDAELKKILNKTLPGPNKLTQFARLQQIELQEEGPLVVARPDVAKALNLAPDQIDNVQTVIAQMTQGREQLNTSQREFFASMRNNGGGGRGGNNNPGETDADRQARQAQVQAQMDKMRSSSTSLKDNAVAQIAKILTKNQRAKFNSMLGSPFELALLNDGRGPNNNNNFGPGGAGGPGGPGGGGPGGGTPAAATGNTATTKNAATTKNGTTTKNAATTKSTTPATKSATSK
jgi:hypothetical protein